MYMLLCLIPENNKFIIIYFPETNSVCSLQAILLHYYEYFIDFQITIIYNVGSMFSGTYITSKMLVTPDCKDFANYK